MHSLVKDLMTTQVVTVGPATPFKEIVARLAEHRVSAVPVVDDDRRVRGIVSEADLLLKEEFPEGPKGGRLFQGRRQRDDRAKAARLLHRHGIKRMPVLDPAGPLLGIVSRADLLKIFLRPTPTSARRAALLPLVHRRRPAGLRWVGTPSDVEMTRGKPRGEVSGFARSAAVRWARRHVVHDPAPEGRRGR